MNRTKTVQVEIARLILEIESEGNDWALPDAYLSFMVDSSNSPAQVLYIRERQPPSLRSAKEIFRARNSWTLYRDESGRFVFDIADSVYGRYARRLAFFTPDFASADVYVQLSDRPVTDPYASYPLEFPLYQIAVLNLLAQGHGVLLHAAAVVQNGKATLFTGPSGAGKSTLARLYEGQDAVTILNDDAVVIRQINGRYWAFGTPWCRDTSVCSPLGAPVDRIFFIEHAPENVVGPIARPDAVATLVSRAFIPFYRPGTIEFNLDFLAGLGQAVPGYRLGFLPDDSVVSFLGQIM